MDYVHCDRGKLPDYTKQGRPDLPCITAAELRHSPDSSIKRTLSLHQLSRFSSVDSSSVQKDASVEESRVDFFLKVPSTRRKPSESERSRKNLILACEQQRPMSMARSNSLRFLLRNDGRSFSGRGLIGRNESFIDRALRRESSVRGKPS